MPQPKMRRLFACSSFLKASTSVMWKLDPAFYEKFYLTLCDFGYKMFETNFAKIGVLICWDLRYPEAARITALSGAEILLYPTAMDWATAQDEATNKEQNYSWQIMQRAHAVSNGVHVVSVNRLGLEQKKVR